MQEMLNKTLMCNLFLHRHPCFWSTLGVNATDASYTSTARGGEKKCIYIYIRSELQSP